MARYKDASALFAGLRHDMDKVVHRARQITKENGEYAADMVQDTVETAGVAKSGKRGRIETGVMRDSVGEKYEDIPSGGQSTFGFIKNTPDYTIYQDAGFTHYKSGEQIAGMFAVDDAFSNVEVDYINDLNRMLKDTW